MKAFDDCTEQTNPCEGCMKDCEECETAQDQVGYVGGAVGARYRPDAPIARVVAALRPVEHGATAAEVRSALHPTFSYILGTWGLA